MNFGELQDELAARGFDYLTDTRKARLINWANHELDDYARWPWREASVTGTSPIQIADLGGVEAVLEMTTDTLLEQAEFSDLLLSYGDLSLVSGIPLVYYRADPAGIPEIATYPSGASIGVQYWRISPELSADTDEPLSPERVHHLIVDLAVCRAYLDRDDFVAAQSLRQLTELELQNLLAVFEISPVSMQIRSCGRDW